MMKYLNFFITLAAIILLTLSSCATAISGKKDNLVTYNTKRYIIIDSHNHDASNNRYKSKMAKWDKYGIDKTILFGNISEPSAIRTDEIAFAAYKEYPERIIPFIAGINIFDKECLNYISNYFNAGVYGIGEIVAASEFSPMTSKLPWKGMNCLDGFLPQIYELCGNYGKPILLHIDPPNDHQVKILVKAAKDYPSTHFIFAHANAYTAPKIIETILETTNNIYIDFFAGFTEYNPDSNYKLNDFVQLIEKYPDRFIVSTDSGYGIGDEKAYGSIIDLLNMLEENTANKIAYENICHLLNIK